MRIFVFRNATDVPHEARTKSFAWLTRGETREIDNFIMNEDE